MVTHPLLLLHPDVPATAWSTYLRALSGLRLERVVLELAHSGRGQEMPPALLARVLGGLPDEDVERVSPALRAQALLVLARDPQEDTDWSRLFGPAADPALGTLHSHEITSLLASPHRGVRVAMTAALGRRHASPQGARRAPAPAGGRPGP